MNKKLVGLTLLVSSLGWIATASPVMANEWGRSANRRGQTAEHYNRDKDQNRRQGRDAYQGRDSNDRNKGNDRNDGRKDGYDHDGRAEQPRPAPARYAPAPTYQPPRRDDRDARHRASVQQIRDRWGATLIQTPAVRSELTIHAQRMARLDRMKDLAEQGGNGGLVARVNVLIQRENARHDALMTSLQNSYYSRR